MHGSVIACEIPEFCHAFWHLIWQIFLRELISNASDALDKIRLLSLTDKDELATNPEMVIRIKADKVRKWLISVTSLAMFCLLAFRDGILLIPYLSSLYLELMEKYWNAANFLPQDNHVLHITDTGIGMTRNDLVNNLGTIAKSGTSEFFSKLQDSESAEQVGLLSGGKRSWFYKVECYLMYILVSLASFFTSYNTIDSKLGMSGSCWILFGVLQLFPLCLTGFLRYCFSQVCLTGFTHYSFSQVPFLDSVTQNY